MMSSFYKIQAIFSVISSPKGLVFLNEFDKKSGFNTTINLPFRMGKYYRKHIISPSVPGYIRKG